MLEVPDLMPGRDVFRNVGVLVASDASIHTTMTLAA